MINWDYQKGMLQVSASLHRYYGLDSEYQSDAAVDEWLQSHHFRCVIALLIDGMGTRIMEDKLSPDSFFRRSLAEEVSTVYPPTTTAATTAFQTGRSPKENGWLGWNQYFHELDDQMILFRSHSQYGPKEYPDYAWTHLPILALQDELNEHGNHADSVWPGWGQVNPCDTYEKILIKLKSLIKDPDLHYIYAYWDELDDLMHRMGPSSETVTEMMQQLDDQTDLFARSLPADVGLLIIADHGQIDVRHYHLDHDRELCGCFRKAPSLEARTMAFFIKPECMEVFPVLFHQKFRESFVLLSHDEVVHSNIFGPGKAHPRFEEFIGDYTAFAISDLQLDYRKGYDLRGNHAGMLDAERMIPVILYPGH
ncbi:MAG: alkaline phosphatase family protein [Solobacterium sp.]|jgi:predicted AlkP superfamily pyrophosphatase or phosphodiesterase|nr:alkaline phosphatase family protein [Solobacterium sp.]